MTSSKSSQKRANKVSFKIVSEFDLFYHLTYMSAMSSAGISRSKTFELAAEARTEAAVYFVAINQLVNELRFDYPEACRRVGTAAKSKNMRSFLLRMSDALRSGEPLSEFLTREASVMSTAYENNYERKIETLKQWSNAFSSVVISVALIIIIQIISAMIYSMDLGAMTGMVIAGIMLSSFAAWIIWRSAPAESMVIKLGKGRGSKKQQRTERLFRLVMPLCAMVIAVLSVMGVEIGVQLLIISFMLVPVGLAGFRADNLRVAQDDDFSQFLRSTGSMAASSGTTVNEALLRLDLSSFPSLEDDIERLNKRLKARIDPMLCWRQFGLDTGSKLISEVVEIFYGGVLIGGAPEVVGYTCSLFVAKVTQLRAKRRLVTGTFSALTTIMQAIVAGLMVFVMSIVNNFAIMVKDIMPTGDAAAEAQQSVNMGMAQFTDAQLAQLAAMTSLMVVVMAFVGAAAIILSDGGYKLKATFYVALMMFISSICMLVVPPMVGGMLTN